MLERRGLSSGFLCHDHVQKVAAESASALILSWTVATPDNEHPAEGEEERLEENLKEMLMLQNGVSTGLLDDKSWDGVFWDPDLARPDREAAAMNWGFQEFDKDLFAINLDAVERMRSSQSIPSHALHSSLQHILMTTGCLPSTFPELDREDCSNLVKKTTISRFLSENHDNIHWDGEKFSVKSVMMYRVDIGHYSSNISLGIFYLKVERYVKLSLCVRMIFRNVFFAESQKWTCPI